MDEGTIRQTQVRLPRALRARLADEAKSQGRSLNGHINFILESSFVEDEVYHRIKLGLRQLRQSL